MKKMLLAASAALALACGAAVAPASAAIVIDIDDSICNNCDNVHLNSDDGADNKTTGDTFTGQTANFTGVENITHSSANGEGLPWVVAVDGTLTSLDIAVQSGFTFNRLGFNLNEENEPGAPSWNVRITAFYDGGSQFEDFFGLKTNTAFKVESTDGGMTHVLIQLLDGIGDETQGTQGLAGENGVPFFYDAGPNRGDPGTMAWDGVGQVKMEGITSIPGIPEPATWAFMIMGFGGAGAMLRRRRAVAA